MHKNIDNIRPLQCIVRGKGMREKTDEFSEKELDLYQEKVDWFDLNFEGKRTSAAAFYRDVFPEGSFENEVGKMDDYPRTGKGNG